MSYYIYLLNQELKTANALNNKYPQNSIKHISVKIKFEKCLYIPHTSLSTYLIN